MKLVPKNREKIRDKKTIKFKIERNKEKKQKLDEEREKKALFKDSNLLCNQLFSNEISKQSNINLQLQEAIINENSVTSPKNIGSYNNLFNQVEPKRKGSDYSSNNTNNNFTENYNNIFKANSEINKAFDDKDEDLFSEFFISKNTKSPNKSTYLENDSIKSQTYMQASSTCNQSYLLTTSNQPTGDNISVITNQNSSSEASFKTTYLNLSNPLDKTLYDKFCNIKSTFSQINDFASMNIYSLGGSSTTSANQNDFLYEKNRLINTKITSLRDRLYEVQTNSTVGSNIIKERLIEQIEIFIELIRLRKLQIELIHLRTKS